MVQACDMSQSPSTQRRYRFPAEIISHAMLTASGNAHPVESPIDAVEGGPQLVEQRRPPHQSATRCWWSDEACSRNTLLDPTHPSAQRGSVELFDYPFLNPCPGLAGARG